jgi:hypothetical protein
MMAHPSLLLDHLHSNRVRLTLRSLPRQLHSRLESRLRGKPDKMQIQAKERDREMILQRLRLLLLALDGKAQRVRMALTERQVPESEANIRTLLLRVDQRLQ